MSRPASSPLEITGVVMAGAHEGLRGAFLGVPKAGDAPDARSLQLRGWVVPLDQPAVGIEVLEGETIILRGSASRRRPDIADHYPDLTHAVEAGFEEHLNLLALTEETELGVRAVLADQRRVPIGTVRLRPVPAAAGEAPERVSVVIPCFNQAHFLGEAIESVLGQTRSAVEIIVIDDGSGDNTVEVAGRYPGVRYVRQENRGLAAARNAGLEHVDAEFVVFLDSDDRLLPAAIESGLRELGRDPRAVMAAGTWRLIGEDGQGLPSTPPEPPDEVYAALLESCFISTPAAVIYRRELFDEIGGFDPAVSASADYDVYLRAAARHRVQIHREVVAEYRRHGANMTRNAELIMRSETEVLRRQAALVRDSPELGRARERGLRRSRAYHGQRMVDEIRRQLDAGQREEAIRATLTLARLHPRGVADVIRALGRRGLR
ncbi:MAG TPA: glycosyltransferase [Solirubrobacterales bacterium]|nr:glycosyltransferase [Solirubrobacterales bacterium]